MYTSCSFSIRKTDRRFHRRGQHFAQENNARGAGAVCHHCFEHGLQRLRQGEAGGNPLAGNQQAVQILQARLQTDAHLLESAAQLADLIFALDAQGTVKLSGSQIFRLCGQALQRPRDRAQVHPQGDQRDQTQQDDHQRDRQGDIDGKLLRFLGRDREHNRPRMA